MAEAIDLYKPKTFCHFFSLRLLTKNSLLIFSSAIMLVEPQSSTANSVDTVVESQVADQKQSYPSDVERIRESLFIPRVLLGSGSRPMLMDLEQRVQGIRALYADHLNTSAIGLESSIEQGKNGETKNFPPSFFKCQEAAKRNEFRKLEKALNSYMRQEIALEERIEKRRRQRTKNLKIPLDADGNHVLAELAAVEITDRERLNNRLSIQEKRTEIEIVGRSAKDTDSCRRAVN